MPRELLILRHAKSDWDAKAPSDFQRPLTRCGKQVAREIGAWLFREGLVPDYVVSSPAIRASQTAVTVCKAMNIPKEKIVWDTDIYDASLAALLDVLGRCPAESTLALLVGHNPGMESVVRYLGDGDLDAPPDCAPIPTAALARLHMPERWDQLPEDGRLLPAGALARLEILVGWDQLIRGCAELIEVIRPRAQRVATEQ